jgi:metal-sulfur cluster biosynthetic enzyme
MRLVKSAKVEINYGSELGVVYEVKSSGGKLHLARPRGDVEMTPTTPGM